MDEWIISLNLSKNLIFGKIRTFLYAMGLFGNQKINDISFLITPFPDDEDPDEIRPTAFLTHLILKLSKVAFEIFARYMNPFWSINQFKFRI
jgi:hypothetical protein